MNFTPKEIDAISGAAHGSNNRFKMLHGDPKDLPWEELTEEQKEITRASVRQITDHPETTAADIHDTWVMSKFNSGWSFGNTKDPEAKTHPLLVSFGELSDYDQAKDVLFVGVVKAWMAAILASQGLEDITDIVD